MINDLSWSERPSDLFNSFRMQVASSEDPIFNKYNDLELRISSEDQQVIIEYNDSETWRFIYTPSELRLNSIQTIGELLNHLERRWCGFKKVHVQRCEWINSKTPLPPTLRLSELIPIHVQRYEWCNIDSPTILIVCASTTNDEQVEAGSSEEQAVMNDSQIRYPKGNNNIDSRTNDGNIRMSHMCMQCPIENDNNKGRREKGMCRFNKCVMPVVGKTKRRGTGTWFCREC